MWLLLETLLTFSAVCREQSARPRRPDPWVKGQPATPTLLLLMRHQAEPARFYF